MNFSQKISDFSRFFPNFSKHVYYFGADDDGVYYFGFCSKKKPEAGRWLNFFVFKVPCRREPAAVLRHERESLLEVLEVSIYIILIVF